MEVIVVVGLEGEEEYQEVFQQNLNHWKTACATAEVPCRVIDDKASLKTALETVGDQPLWLVLIGHGTFNGRVAKFNIKGDDFTSSELSEWCKGIKREFVLINTTSASAPFIREMAGKNRTIITATKSANEIFYARFGNYFSEAITGIDEADLDNDEQVSLLEGYLYAADKVSEFYQQEGRLATEHALIEDNGDGMGTRADWFEGTTATKTAKEGAKPDGLRAMQQVLVKNELEKAIPAELLTVRNELEADVRFLRSRKSEMAEKAYYTELEALLLKLAKIYQEVEAAKASNN